MAIFREILIGQPAVAELMGDREVQVLNPGQSRAFTWPYSVACMVMEHGVNVCTAERYGFPLTSWGERGFHLVEWPVSPLTEDYDGFLRSTAEVLLPVVDSALAAVADARAQHVAVRP